MLGRQRHDSTAMNNIKAVGHHYETAARLAPERDDCAFHLTGVVNGNGTVTIYAITSTVSGNTDQGADPNKLVAITDDLSATSLPAAESFVTLRSAGYGEVLRGVSLTPVTARH